VQLSVYLPKRKAPPLPLVILRLERSAKRGVSARETGSLNCPMRSSALHAAHQEAADLAVEIAVVQKALEGQAQTTLQLAGQLASLGAKAEQLSATATVTSDAFEQSSSLQFTEKMAQPSKDKTGPVASNIAIDEVTPCRLTTVPDSMEHVDDVGRRPLTADSQDTRVSVTPRGGGLFQDPQELKEQIRDALRNTPCTVTTYHKKTGLFQAIAKHHSFEQSSLALVIGSSLWIAVDLDFNHAVMLHEADVGFKVIANILCLLFVAELMVRVLAFERLRDTVKDPWMLLDLLLVMTMVVETWVFWFLFAAAGFSVSVSNMKVLVVLRMLRLMRILRLAKLFRFLPEMLVIIRGILVAMRAISMVFLLLSVILYVGAIAFRVLLENTSVGREHFETVSQAMGTLLLDCALSGAKGAALMRETYQVHPIYAVTMFAFVLIANLTMMGVLGALLVQSIKKIAELEEEERRIMHNHEVMDELWQFIVAMDENHDGYIAYEEFFHMLSEPQTLKFLKALDVDPEILISLSDFVFEENQGRLSQEAFNQWVLDLRGGTLKDHYLTRKFVKAKLTQLLEAAPKVDGLDVQTSQRKLDSLEAKLTQLLEAAPKEDGLDVQTSQRKLDKLVTVPT